jgi:hypothetical protein
MQTGNATHCVEYLITRNDGFVLPDGVCRTHGTLGEALAAIYAAGVEWSGAFCREYHRVKTADDVFLNLSHIAHKFQIIRRTTTTVTRSVPQYRVLVAFGGALSEAYLRAVPHPWSILSIDVSGAATFPDRDTAWAAYIAALGQVEGYLRDQYGPARVVEAEPRLDRRTEEVDEVVA